ncbi:MAG: OsmC family protein [Gemmatimonadaceae bacterium]
MTLATRVPIVVTHDAGSRFSARVRGHHVESDQPITSGGTDTAPTPVELLGAALGSCIALYVHKFLAARSLPTDGVRVEVQATAGNYAVRVMLAERPGDQHLMMLGRVVRSCPVHQALEHGAQIVVEIAYP